MFYYENHLGGIYVSDNKLSFEDRCCNTCGDFDWEIGEFDTFEQFLFANADSISYYNSGGYVLEAIIEDCCPGFDYDKAMEIVGSGRHDSSVNKYKVMHELMENYCPEKCEGCKFDAERDVCLIEQVLENNCKEYTPHTNQLIVDTINNVIEQAVKDGGDAGGAYHQNTEELKKAIDNLLVILKLDDYDIKEQNSASTWSAFKIASRAEKE